MNKVILLLAILAVASATKADAFQGLWSTFKIRYQKFYDVAEEITRFSTFIQNCEKIQRLNSQNDGVKYGINQFTDLTDAEFSDRFASNAAFYADEEGQNTFDEVILPVGALPESVDWRDKNAVTPVKDQGHCGSCWAFSTTGVLESFYYINNGKLLTFSEQQFVDCSALNHGCNGGLPYLALKYAANKGVELESDYPYTAKDGKCAYDAKKTVAVTGGYKLITTKSTEQLKTAIVAGPVSVAVQADQDAFRYYKSGVVTKDCGAALNHAVLAVGYKKIDGVEAFIVKNSWATTWGQEGYIHIGTDQTQNKGKGVCGILGMPVIATKLV